MHRSGWLRGSLGDAVSDQGRLLLALCVLAVLSDGGGDPAIAYEHDDSLLGPPSPGIDDLPTFLTGINKL